MSLEVGQPAPLFTLRDAAGKSVSLNDMKGRTVVLYFYPKDDTPGCTKEACGFRDLWSEIESTGAVVLGISPDDPDSHERFSRKFNLPFLLLSDPDHKVMEQYGAWGERRKWYGRRLAGVIRSTVLIDPEGTVRKHWAKIDDAERHPAEVLQSLHVSAP